MKMTYAERKVEVSEKTKEYAAKKCEKLDRYFSKDTSAKVTFSEIKDRHIVEITVAHNGMLFRASDEKKDLYPAIDDAVENIERQILKNKTRLEKKLRMGAFDKIAEREQLEAVQSPAEDIYNVIRTKEFEVKPMLVEEALLQMNLLGHQFFFFRNSEEDDRYSVVYKRNNGGYGLIISK